MLRDRPRCDAARGRPAAWRIASAIAGPGHASWSDTGGVLNVERCGIRYLQDQGRPRALVSRAELETHLMRGADDATPVEWGSAA